MNQLIISLNIEIYKYEVILENADEATYEKLMVSHWSFENWAWNKNWIFLRWKYSKLNLFFGIYDILVCSLKVEEKTK